MRVLPIYFMEHLTDDVLSEHECSDRIWVSERTFKERMEDAEPGEVILLQLTNSVQQIAIGSIYSTHTKNDENDLIYIPAWMYKLLEIDDEVEVTRYQPSLCTGLQLQPHTSDHLIFSDPEITLRNAFEKYTCLTPGTEIPLWIGYPFIVTIAGLVPNTGETLCIRNCELALDLLTPLDTPIQEFESESKNETIYTPISESKIVEHVKEDTGQVVGGIISQKSKRELAAEAALRRMK